MAQREFGTEGRGYNAASKAYKADPRVEKYIELRRSEPAAEIEVSVVGGFDSLFYMRDEFARFGLDPDLLGGILDANLDAIGEVALRIMEEIVAARRLQSSGETHLISRGRVIPDKLIDWTICCALDALSWNDDLTIPRDLIVLIRERLGGSDPHYEQVGRVREQKQAAAMIGGQLKARGIHPTFKLLGESMGVSPSTVMRWFEAGEFEQATDLWSRHFDEAGALKPLRVEAS